LFDYLTRERGLAPETARQSLLADYVASGARASPSSLRGVLPERVAPVARAARTLAERQDRHAGPKISA
jgi:hypothetical protein